MNAMQPAFGVVPAAGGAAGGAKVVTIIIVAVVVVGALFIGALAIALGVGLGVGLRKSDSALSKLTAPNVTCNATGAYCGCPSITPTFSSRIIRGDTSKTNSWPWMVAVYIGTTRICSGFLVSYEDVITAASCVSGVTVSTITVYAGISTLANRANGLTFNVTNVTIPTTYSASTFQDDIAILRLGGVANISSTVGYCCLVNSTAVPASGENGVIAGWGQTSLTSSQSNTLQQAVLQTQSTSTCGTTSTTARKFCAKTSYLSSSCPSDVGGPFMTSTNGSWTCSGVINGDTSSCYTTPTFTRVGNFATLIADALAF